MIFWIYDVTSVGGTGSKFVFTRSSDSNTSSQVRQGMQVKVLEGDVYEGCVASIDLSVAPGAQIVLNTSPVVVVTGVNSPSLWTGGAALTIGNAVYSIILHAAHCEVEAPLKIPSYNVNSLPAVTGLTGCIIWVNNDKSGATFARCNGTNWLRTDTGAIIASS